MTRGVRSTMAEVAAKCPGPKRKAEITASVPLSPTPAKLPGDPSTRTIGRVRNLHAAVAPLLPVHLHLRNPSSTDCFSRSYSAAHQPSQLCLREIMELQFTSEGPDATMTTCGSPKKGLVPRASATDSKIRRDLGGPTSAPLSSAPHPPGALAMDRGIHR